MKLIAYRGHTIETPPNSRAAIQIANDNEVDGIYLDANYTKDEIIVCNGEFENSNLSLMGLTSNHTLEEVKKIDLGDTYGARYKGEKILTLAEAIDLVNDGMEIYLGLVSGSRRFPNIEERILDFIIEHELMDRISIVSLDHLALKWLKKINSSVRTFAMHYARFARPVDFALDVMADGIASYHYLLTSFVIDNAHRELLEVIAFPVNNLIAIKDMQELNVDIVFSPDAKLIQDFRQKNI